jgi:hypothetical protein
MPMQQVRTAGAITKPEFHARLRAWLQETDEATIGPSDIPGVSPWVYVQDGGSRYEFHADVKREAVERYLQLVDRYGDGLEWSIVSNQRGKQNDVAYGPDQERVTPLYLYLV